jgi:hypothetical protein
MKMDPSIDRLEELWADRATGGEDAGDVHETRQLRRRLGVSDDLNSMDFAAGQLSAGFVHEVGVESMPLHVQRKISQSIRASGATSPKPYPWLITAAAASIAIFVALKQPGFSMRSETDSSQFVRASWSDWDSPEVAGVRGEVAWCEVDQSGSMRFTGLPVNDPSKERYQLWIIDSRGMSQRISGGVFDSDGGEVNVPIQPGIRVCGAQAFAITIERPEGVWVSDMTRRVSIAQIASK